MVIPWTPMFFSTFFTSSTLKGLTTATTTFMCRLLTATGRRHPAPTIPRREDGASPGPAGIRLRKPGYEILPKYGGNGPFKRGRYPSWVPTSPPPGASGDHDEHPMTAWERIKYTLVRPDDDPTGRGAPLDDRTVEELEEAIRRSDDKERTIGLVAAPVAAIVGIAISSASINYARAHNQNVHVYEELTYVLLGLAVLILIASLMRKRLFQGITLGPLRSGRLPAELHLCRFRGPLHPLRCVVPGAHLPPPAGAQAG